MKFGMLACCAVMIVPTIGWFAAGGSISSLSEGMTALLPVLGCLAIHGAMFLVMGKTCRRDDAHDHEAVPDAPEAAKVPVVGRRTSEASGSI